MNVHILKPRKVIIVDADRRIIGRVPTYVARELIEKRHARLLQKSPTTIELSKIGRAAQSDKVIQMNNPLKNIVSIASMFAERSNRTEAHNAIAFRIMNNRLWVTASYLESHFQGYLEPSKPFTLTHDKSTDTVCVSADQAKKILSSPGEITHIHIKGGEMPGVQIGSFFIEGFLPDEQFPDMRLEENVRKSHSYTIANIAQKLNFVGKTVPVNKYKAVLCGIYFDFARQQLVGSDGSRLHTVSMVEPGEKRVMENSSHGAIVPSKLLRVARYLTGQVKIVEGNDAVHHALFNLNIPGCVDCTVGYRTIDGHYPNYADVIPKGFDSKLIVKTKELLSILSKSQTAISSRDTHTIAVECHGGQLTVSVTHNNKRLYQGTARGSYVGLPYRGLMNVDYFIDALQSMPGDSTEILLQRNSNEAWTIRNSSGFSAIIMPVEMEK